MPIRDVTSGVTGGIGPIRYVENGVTVNIPIAYVVENGVTALVYQEEVEEKVYTPPSQDTYYLYNRGTMSEVLGGFTSENASFTYAEESGYLSLTCPKGVVLSGKLVCNHIMNLSAYKWLRVEYEYISASTGTLPTGLTDIYTIMVRDSGNTDGYNNSFGLYAEPTGVKRESGLWEDTYIYFQQSWKMEMSTTEDVIMRIYSIYISKE